MKRKLTAVGLGLAAVGLLAIGAPDSHAACGSSSYATTDTTVAYPGNADNGFVYAHGNGASQTDVTAGGYAGIKGDHGYLEAGGTPTNPSTAEVSGSTANTPTGLNGSLTSAGICINDQHAP